MVRNIRKGRISPQFHVIFDDNFETVRTEEGIEPLVWEELLTTNSFRSNIEDNDDLPTLDKEWFDAEELRERVMKDRCEMEKRGSITNYPRNSEIAISDKTIVDNGMISNVESGMNKDSPVVGNNEIQPVRRSNRARKSPDRLEYKQLGGGTVNALMIRMVRNIKKFVNSYSYLMSLLMDGDTGLMEDLPFDSLSRGLMMMNGYKSTIYDPDTPNYSQEMSGKYSEEYKKEMKE